MEKDKIKLSKIDEILQKKFHKKLISPFCQAINKYHLIDKGDKIAVCMSGGKDSSLMAKLFQEVKRHNKIPFDLVFLAMDPGYSMEDKIKLKQNAKALGVPIKIFKADIFKNIKHIEKSPCYICARMRRGYLYSKAKELGCNKIALGHHFNDVIETILMGMIYGGQIQTMMPKLRSIHFKGMELIRPMYLIHEKDILAWRDCINLDFLHCSCDLTRTSQIDESKSKRRVIKALVEKLSKENPQIEQNIFKSVENVNLATVISYKDKMGIRHPFLDEY